MTIERELNTLWRAEVEANQKAGAAEPPSRTLLHTLLVVAPDAAAAEQARQVAAALSPRQPARTLVLQLGDGAADRLDASVALTCVNRPNGLTTVAGEQVTVIAAGLQAARRLTGAVLPLLLTNVPSFLWWMQGSPVNHPLLRDLAPVLDRLIVDSYTFAAPDRDLPAWQQAVADPHFAPIVSDLTWARLAPWRYAVAQIFDATAARAHLAHLRHVEVRYAPGPATLAGLFAGWLAARLGWQVAARDAQTLRFTGGQTLSFLPVADLPGLAPGYFAGVTLATHQGAEFEVNRHGLACTVTRQRLAGLHTERVVPLRSESLTEWLGHELGRLSATPTYEAALRLLTAASANPEPEIIG
ncbi:MAG: glucose-6-phosphate dehydrogenase assembly protein OpcA [Anaerolineales bacterium]|nr:glucose-6-phosphate dehydrogenase assembly protein OpcA [Anaerolineales bacterium]